MIHISFVCAFAFALWIRHCCGSYVINCTDEDAIHGCNQNIVNTTLSNTSLHVICTYPQCKSFNIYCPVSTNSHFTCEIDCLYPSSCSHLNIYGNHHSNVMLNCEAANSCNNINIFANTSPNCDISCNKNGNFSKKGSCNSLTIHGESITNNLNLNCLGTYSCYDLSLYANSTHNMSIQATGDYAINGNVYAMNAHHTFISCSSKQPKHGSCVSTLFYLPQSNESTHLECVGYGCYYLSFHRANGWINAFHTIDSYDCDVDDLCGSHQNCMSYWDISCGSDYSTQSQYHLFQSCPTDTTATCPCNAAFTDLYRHSFITTHSDKCDALDTVSCGYHLDCSIKCDSHHSCQHMILNGTTSRSMTITCESDYYACSGVQIYCPADECTISCIHPDICSGLVVYGQADSIINIYCTWIACWTLQVHASYAKEVNIECTDCYQMIAYANYTEILRFTGGGSNANIFAPYANSIEVTGNGDHMPIIHARYAHNISIHCLTSRITVYAENATFLNFTSEKSQWSSVVSGSVLYLPKNGRSQINCIGYGCAWLSLTGFSNSNTNVSLFNNNQCIMPSSCIDYWSIYCGGGDKARDHTTGNSCSSNHCGCYELNKRIQASFDQNNALNYSSFGDIACAIDSACTIHCLATNNCTGTELNGYKASSLTVYCDSKWSCKNARIYCPQRQNCAIYCAAEQSCYRAVIYVDTQSNLDLIVTGNNGFDSGSVYGYAANMFHGIFKGYKSSYHVHLKLLNARNITIECAAHLSCNRLDVEAESATSITVIGHNSNSTMSKTTIHADNARYITILCYGNNTIGYSGWTAGYNGCYGAEFYLPSSNGNRTKIACYGSGCYDMKFNIDGGFYALAQANLILNACDLCELGTFGYDCVKQWAVDCGQWWEPNKLNSAGSCHDVENGYSRSSSDCQCYTPYRNMLINAFVNDGRDLQCLEINTLSPTLAPTASPTAIPTSEPTWNPTFGPSISPSMYPSTDPTLFPSVSPTSYPSKAPTTTVVFTSEQPRVFIMSQLFSTLRIDVKQQASTVNKSLKLVLICAIIGGIVGIVIIVLFVYAVKMKKKPFCWYVRLKPSEEDNQTGVSLQPFVVKTA
eukprot:34646_1